MPSDVIIEYWNENSSDAVGAIGPSGSTVRGLTPQQHVDNGHLIANENPEATYFVLGGGGTSNLPWRYEGWELDDFGLDDLHDPLSLRADSRARNLGSTLHVWADHPNDATEIDIAGRISQPMRVLAQRLWGAPNPARSYAEFEALSDKVGSHPDTGEHGFQCRKSPMSCPSGAQWCCH